MEFVMTSTGSALKPGKSKKTTTAKITAGKKTAVKKTGGAKTK